MLKAIETENVIKNIIREITRECASRGITITDNCAAYVIKLMVLNPDHGFISDHPLAREDVQLLVDICVQRLSEEHSCTLATIQMQVYFDSNFAPRQDIVNENRTNIKLRTVPLIKEIIESSVKTKDDSEKLYRKMVVATVVISGLGNPTQFSVLREATAALSSVFPHTELSQFMTMSRRDKEQQVNELTQIITGIRLFNRDCMRGGEGIEDLPELLQKAIDATNYSLQSQLQILLHHISVFTTAIEKCIRIPGEPVTEDQNAEKKDSGESIEILEGTTLQFEEIPEISRKQIQMVLDGLVAARQLEVYYRKLLLEVETSQQMLAELLDKLKSRLNSIHDTVRFRTAIPTIQVYPQFIHMSEIWCSLQDEMVILSNINNLAWNLQKYFHVLEFPDKDVIKHMIGNFEVLTDEDRLKATTGLKISQSENKCEVIYPVQVTDFENISLQCTGFCIWSLVVGQGALIPGNPNMGVCQWKGNYYAFSTPAAANEFGQDPDDFVLLMINLMRKKPELINLLQMQEQVAAAQLSQEVPVKKPELKIKHDIEIQTELHPIPSNIDLKYMWNEWDLKREAIKLTNIVRSATKSVQTQRSSHRMNIGVEVKPPRTQEVQTMQDVMSNVPTLQNYIFGLRGRKGDKQFVFTLTRPVQE